MWNLVKALPLREDQHIKHQSLLSKQLLLSFKWHCGSICSHLMTHQGNYTKGSIKQCVERVTFFPRNLAIKCETWLKHCPIGKTNTSKTNLCLANSNSCHSGDTAVPFVAIWWPIKVNTLRQNKMVGILQLIFLNVSLKYLCNECDCNGHQFQESLFQIEQFSLKEIII